MLGLPPSMSVLSHFVSRPRHRRARRRPGPVLGSGLVLALALLQAIFVVLPTVHEWRERGGASPAAGGVDTASPGCPLDCQEAGHHHHHHDCATCGACQSLRAPALATSHIQLIAPTTVVAREAPGELLVRPRRLIGPCSLRAPPTVPTTA